MPRAGVPEDGAAGAGALGTLGACRYVEYAWEHIPTRRFDSHKKKTFLPVSYWLQVPTGRFSNPNFLDTSFIQQVTATYPEKFPG